MGKIEKPVRKKIKKITNQHRKLNNKYSEKSEKTKDDDIYTKQQAKLDTKKQKNLCKDTIREGGSLYNKGERMVSKTHSSPEKHQSFYAKLGIKTNSKKEQII